mmetsp:Transcript_140424/g.436642  ORF Transcript_140424/g.436642 Transcript_140424/m.436642 type:complete len:229 (+) Transcript_140424:627-1313(+)
MRQGHTGSERSRRCSRRSQPRYMATTLLCGAPSQADILCPHSSKQGRNSAPFTFITAPSTSSQFRLNCSSSSAFSLSESESSSTICCKAFLAATLSSFLSFSSTCVRCKDWSISVNNLPAICFTSSALRMPGPAFLMQSATPEAACAIWSASWLASNSAKVGLRQARRSSAATAVPGSPRSSAPARAALMSSAQVCSTAPCTSSHQQASSSAEDSSGASACAVGWIQS